MVGRRYPRDVDRLAECVCPANVRGVTQKPCVGGVDWYETIDNLIAGIERGSYRLWAVAKGQSVWVTVARRSNRRKYLKTQPDPIEPDNRLALPRC
nr:DUF3892 domain-containing protein [Phyllobacterium sp. SYP-B3895]